MSHSEDRDPNTQPNLGHPLALGSLLHPPCSLPCPSCSALQLSEPVLGPQHSEPVHEHRSTSFLGNLFPPVTPPSFNFEVSALTPPLPRSGGFNLSPSAFPSQHLVPRHGTLVWVTVWLRPALLTALQDRGKERLLSCSLCSPST